MLPKKKSIAAVVAAATCASLLARGEAPTYVLGVPAAPTMYISSNAGDNEWLAANNAYAAMSIAATTGGVSRVVDVDSPQMELASAEAGFPIERSKPDYYLADVIEPPENVDWAATYANYIALPASERSNFIFDDDSCRLFAAKGGTVNFTWALSDGTSRLMTYIVSLSCSGRPRRIYWTDYPYNAPGIDLTGKFVKFLGNDELLTIRYGSVTNVTAGIPQVITNKIVSGVHLDPSTKMLYAYGQLQGQAVMAYYDTGTFDRLLHVQVIEVCRPQVNRMKGEIGRALKPDGRGYDVSGLRAQPTYVQPSDNRGDWYYQHQGQHSYSPKHGNVYPLRPTKDCPWNMEVYWMETDEMEVDWPFELDQYECDWPADATVFVRGSDGGGRPVYVPSDYTATLMKYQDPEGHARAVETDGTFYKVEERRPRMEVVGDSITCGFGNEAPNNSFEFKTSEENGWLAYGPLAARELGYDVSMICESGIAAVVPEHPLFPMHAMEDIYRYTDKLYDDKYHKDSGLWDFEKEHNDIVVLNLGTNDCTPIRFYRDFSEVADMERWFHVRYKEFVKQVRNLNGPDTYIMCGLGSMDYYLYHHIKEVVNEIKQETGDQNICCFEFIPINIMFEGYGAMGHPSAKTHARMGKELANYIRKFTGE